MRRPPGLGGEEVAKNQTEYKAEYARKHYARIEFTIPKEAKPALEGAAAEAGEKPTEYVKKAVLLRMGLQDWPKLQATDEDGE